MVNATSEKEKVIIPLRRVCFPTTIKENIENSAQYYKEDSQAESTDSLCIFIMVQFEKLSPSCVLICLDDDECPTAKVLLR